MIRYRLECSSGHGFEAWFASSDAYDRQEADGLLECPRCGTHEVRKAMMAPNVAKGRKGRPDNAQPVQASQSEQATEATTVAHGPEAVMLRQAQAMLRAIRDKVKSEAEYVGPRFADEARRIHFEEAPNRGIYGEATREEVTSLAEDGIDVTPLPPLPEDLS